MNKKLEIKIINDSLRGKLIGKLSCLLLLSPIISLPIGYPFAWIVYQDPHIHLKPGITFLDFVLVWSCIPFFVFSILSLIAPFSEITIPLFYWFGLRPNNKEKEKFFLKDKKRLENDLQLSKDKEKRIKEENKKELKGLSEELSRRTNREKERQKEIEEKIKELNNSF